MARKSKASKLDKVLVCFLVVFVSLLSFSVGVISGKGLSDKHHALKQLESTVDKTYADAKKEAEGEGSIEDTIELSDREISELAEKSLEKARAEQGVNPSKTSIEERNVASEDTANRIAQGKAPSKLVKSPPRKPQSLPPKAASTVGKKIAEYTVQIAAYPSLSEAKKHVGSLTRKGFPAFPVEAKVGKKIWYRVSVGSFKTRKAAISYQSDLVKQDVVKDPIVQRIKRE